MTLNTLKRKLKTRQQESGKQTYTDNFIQENLPSISDWPDLINLDKFDFPEHLNCATELLDKAIEGGYGNKTAIITPDQSWTYQQLLDCSNQVANYLTNELGVIPGNRILLYSYNNFMMVSCWLAIVKVGGVVVAVHPAYKPEGIVSIINKAQTSIALCENLLEERLKAVKETAVTLKHITAFSASPDSNPILSTQLTTFKNIKTAANDCCMIAFTSGTTGDPKAAVHFHRDVIIVCQIAGKEVFRGSEEDVFLGTPSLAFGFGLGSLLLCPLYCRASSVILEDPTPAKLLSSIEKYRASLLFTSAQTYHLMGNQSGSHDLSSLRFCTSGGEQLLHSIWKSWKEKTGISLFQGIGSTEMLYLYIGSILDDAQAGCLGLPATWYEAIILDHEGKELPPNQVGQLAVRGPIGCRYLNDERQKKFVVNGWNVTDDLAHKDEDGNFWHHGRIDNRIISDSRGVIATDVEDTLLTHELVSECAVVSAPDKKSGSIVKAYIVLKKSLDTDNIKHLVAIIKRHAQATLAQHECPQSIEFVDSLPRTATGKLQRYKLRISSRETNREKF